MTAGLAHEGWLMADLKPLIGKVAAGTPLTRAEARVVRRSGLGFIWVVASEEPGLAGRLTREGAVGAYRNLPISTAIAGCFAYADAKAQRLMP